MGSGARLRRWRLPRAMTYDPVADRADRVARLRAQLADAVANLAADRKIAAGSGRPTTALYAEAIRDGMLEVERLDRELEREGG